jgi:hypothetical protein
MVKFGYVVSVSGLRVVADYVGEDRSSRSTGTFVWEGDTAPHVGEHEVLNVGTTLIAQPTSSVGYGEECFCTKCRRTYSGIVHQRPSGGVGILGDQNLDAQTTVLDNGQFLVTCRECAAAQPQRLEVASAIVE